jgi:glycosyltransferase involved in cell wall biosynthesis
MRVSIVITNYNYAAYLPAAIESALAQSHDNVEIVVVDDGSSDGSREIIARYSAAVMPVLKQNGGQGSAVNAGFAACSGDAVLFLDADDELLPKAAASVARLFADRRREGALAA